LAAYCTSLASVATTKLGFSMWRKWDGAGLGVVGCMGFDLAGENLVRGLGTIFAKGARECIELDRQAEWRIERDKVLREVCVLRRGVFF
jgi:hypothetical protein